MRGLVTKVRQAWPCESLNAGTFHVQTVFGLGDFVSLQAIDAALEGWVAGARRRRSLILAGDGGLGKNELACVLAHAASPARAFHCVNKVDRIRDVQFAPGGASLLMRRAWRG